MALFRQLHRICGQRDCARADRSWRWEEARRRFGPPHLDRAVDAFRAKGRGDHGRIDIELAPPCRFVTAAMNLAMMAATERDRELIADLARECSALGEAQMMGVAGLPPWVSTGTPESAGVAGALSILTGVKREVVTVCHPNRVRAISQLLLDWQNHNFPIALGHDYSEKHNQTLTTAAKSASSSRNVRGRFAAKIQDNGAISC